LACCRGIGSHFYQKNATVTVTVAGWELYLRWLSGDKGGRLSRWDRIILWIDLTGKKSRLNATLEAGLTRWFMVRFVAMWLRRSDE